MEIQTTNGITVAVQTQYLQPESGKWDGEFIFGYHIIIENGSPHTVQLLRRHWIIMDADGQIREVKGEGVIGEKPILAPGQRHEYASFCNLNGEIGKMHGTFLMVRKDDESYFEVAIPAFKMAAPHRLN